METKPGTREDLTDQQGHEDVRTALRLFSLRNAEKLPDFLRQDSGGFGKIMLDLLKVSEYEVFLPVIVRSTDWLSSINQVEGLTRQACIHSEIWPVQNRLELIGGLYEVSEGDFLTPLMDYLNSSVEYWESEECPCAICVSERAKEVIESAGCKEILKKVETIELSEEYKQAEIVFY